MGEHMLMGVSGLLEGEAESADGAIEEFHYISDFVTTDILGYSDTLGTREKCHCKQMFD